MTFISFFPNYKFALVSCKLSRFLNFHVSHLNHETFKLCLQNTLNMSKMTMVYFGVLQFMSQSELRGSREELRAARDELRNKTALLDGARSEASEAVSSVERLTEECHGLRGDLHRQETLVVQRDKVIANLRDEACTQWASRWFAFQRKAANAYPGLDLNFDIPSDEEVEESLSVDYSGEPDTPAKAHSPSSPSAPSSDV